MSDGMTDAAREAEYRARKLVKERYDKLTRIQCASAAPKKGTVVYIYEAWLDHVVEVIKNRLVIERWLVKPYGEPYYKQLKLGRYDWQVGYYAHNAEELRRASVVREICVLGECLGKH